MSTTRVHVKSSFLFNDTATTEIYTLSLHDALPISRTRCGTSAPAAPRRPPAGASGPGRGRRRDPESAATLSQPQRWRSEEHTSELQSRQYLVCRLLLEKKHLTTTSLSLSTHMPPLH